MNGQAPSGTISGAFSFAQLGTISENALRQVQAEIERLEAELVTIREQVVTRKAEADRLRRVVAYLNPPTGGKPANKPATPAVTGTREQRVVAYLEGRGADGASALAVAEDAGIGVSYAGQLLRALVAKGVAEQAERGVYRLWSPAERQAVAP